MKLTFIGANHEVTGSCTLLEACGKKILIDCGLEQGPDEYENIPLPVDGPMIDCVFLTHAHMDHAGKIPYLVAKGFGGTIYSTDPTADLCDIMLKDSAHIQEFEAEWRNRKALRAGREPYVPLYTMQDALDSIKLFEHCAYGEEIDVCDGIKIKFTDVGHLLGSASIEIWINEDGTNKKLVFSGDIGNTKQPIIKDPTYLTSADYVVMESTYGNRSHGDRPDYIKQLTEILQRTFDRGGNVVIPAFAVGRSQEMLYFIRQIKKEKLVRGHEGFPVYLDSPLAIEATNVFKENGKQCFDEETMNLIKSGINPIKFDGLKISTTSDESKLINFDKNPKVIISASGMCDAGRIKHHLKHNLWDSKNSVLFVGYQAVGSLGRIIAEGAKDVKIFGESIHVEAEICKFDGVSGHADDNGLLKWASEFGEGTKRFFIVHGDDEACETFTKRLENELKVAAVAPYSGDSWDLTQDIQTVQGDRKKVEKKPRGEASEIISPSYARLLAAGDRIMAAIRKNKGGTNKDLAKMTDMINSISDKLDK